MKTTIRKGSESKLRSKEKTKEEPPTAKRDDKEKTIANKRSISNAGTPRNNLSTPRNNLTTPRNNLATTQKNFTSTKSNLTTPRNYVQKSSTSDIYAQKKNATQSVKAHRKNIGGTNNISNVSSMKDLLKSSPSVNQTKKSEEIIKKNRIKETSNSANKTPRLAKDLPFANVTVNSPESKKKLNLNTEGTIENSVRKTVGERQRTKTRTLKEDEVKMLTPDIVDNNAEMLNLSRRLGAQPKAFFVDLDDGETKVQTADGASDEEVSYEDDFESYESDFESYHSDTTTSSNNVQTEQSDGNKPQSDKDGDDDDETDSKSGIDCVREINSTNGESESEDTKEMRDEEKMLDSGNFDLRDSQRSANRAKPAVMDFILEDSELDVRVSLTDEGFQEMSSSSAVSSMKTVHVDVLDRPLFIDFTKGKQNKRKRRIFERLKQRAADILSMVTLHEMSYSLFEMQPIPYDVYMATFGRSNYMQTSVQTFDDGVPEEVQTDEIESLAKWTQYPVEFSNHDIYLKQGVKSRKYSKTQEDYVTKFTILLNETINEDVNNKMDSDVNYKSNPLRIYLEQQNGVGNGEMLPYEIYDFKLKNSEFNVNRLRRFLKKVESKVSNVLSINTNSEDLPDIVKSSKYTFSKGFVTLSNKNVADEKLAFLNNAKITGIIYPEYKSNLILTVHKTNIGTIDRCIVCLWNLSVAKREPLKILTAIDNIIIGKFIGNTDGIFVAALDDGSIHLWDLSEEPMWQDDIASDKKSTNLVEINVGAAMTQIEKDREWNLKNSHVSPAQFCIPYALQACAYTSSADNLLHNHVADSVVGLQVDCGRSQDAARKLVGQVCALQRIGILTIWSLIQEKIKTTQDIGKAFWSKMRLEKSHVISLTENISATEISSNKSFNLNAAKRRILLRRKERTIDKVSRAKSAVSFDRPMSGVKKKVLPTENSWENGIVCNDLKIMKHGGVDNFLIAKNCGEVLCCTRSAGSVKVNKFSVTNETSSVTCLEISLNKQPYFLAATDVGTVNLCSVVDARVLLTLDSRNYPVGQVVEKYQSDPKGRYLGSATVKPSPASPNHTQIVLGISVKSVFWSQVDSCCIYALLRDGTLVSWELTHSDIWPATVSERVARAVAVNGNTLALLTPEGEVQIHRLPGETSAENNQQLFTKYVALL